MENLPNNCHAIPSIFFMVDAAWNGFIKIFPAHCADMTLLTLSKHALPCTIVGLRLYGRVTLFHHLTRINSLHRNFISLFITFLLFISLYKYLFLNLNLLYYNYLDHKTWIKICKRDLFLKSFITGMINL